MDLLSSVQFNSLTSDSLDPVVFNRFRINNETMDVSNVCWVGS